MKGIDRVALAQAIERRAKKDLEASNIGCASILVATADEILYKRHFFEEGTPWDGLSDKTLFRLASMTKPITAAVTLRLVEQGLLSLEDTVDRFYPEFSSMRVWHPDGKEEPTEQKITVKNLLTHSSGIGSGRALTEASEHPGVVEKSAVEPYVAFLSHLPLSFVPNTAQEYSGVAAFSVLAGILQQVSGLSYDALVKREILDPCGMVDTTFDPTEEQWARMTPMHGKEDGRSVIGQTCEGCVFEDFRPKSYLGGAGLASSLSDYLRFARMLMNGGVSDGVRVLSEESVRAMSSYQFFKRGREAWGLSVRVINEDGGTLPKGAYGWSGAYGTHFWIDPSNGILAIYMKNSRYDGGAGAITSVNFEVDVYSAMRA